MKTPLEAPFLPQAGPILAFRRADQPIRAFCVTPDFLETWSLLELETQGPLIHDWHGMAQSLPPKQQMFSIRALQSARRLFLSQRRKKGKGPCGTNQSPSLWTACQTTL